VRLLREIRPQVLLTFGADGIYGHYDHIAVHHWAKIAVRMAADPDCFPDPELCDPHQVSKLYYRTLSQAQIDGMAETDQPAAVMMDGVPFPFVAHGEDEITTIIDVSDYVQAKLDGIRCHATQIGRHNRFSDTPEEVLREKWFGQESFILAHSSVGWPEGIESDLFAGLR